MKAKPRGDDPRIPASEIDDCANAIASEAHEYTPKRIVVAKELVSRFRLP